MKKIIIALCVAVILSTALPAGIYANGSLEYALENDIADESFAVNPDRPATRAEAARAIAGALKPAVGNMYGNFGDISSETEYSQYIGVLNSIGIVQGNGDSFRPNDLITREEFAVILDRVYKYISDRAPNVPELSETRFLDSSEVSEWARPAVATVASAGIMLGAGRKRFLPKETMTIAQVLAAAEKIHKTPAVAVDSYSVYDTDINPESKFSVYQKSENVKPWTALTGLGLFARFDNAPGEVYFSYTTKKPAKSVTNDPPFNEVVTFARITDPDGHVVARVRLDNGTDGTVTKIINVKNRKPGIWQLQILGGRTGDSYAIGADGCTSWGVRGEDMLTYSETTPKEGYFYVPQKINEFRAGASGAFTIKDLEDKIIASSAAATTGENTAQNQVTVENLTPDSVYKIVMPNAFRGQLQMIGATMLLCPTAEMAADLKGNIKYLDGYQLKGPIQERARKAALDIYNKYGGDMEIKVPDPGPLPEIQGNPIYEAAFLSLRGIGMLDRTMKLRCLNPECLFLGAEYTDRTHECELFTDNVQTQTVGDRGILPLGDATSYGPAIIDAELNTMYGNQKLIDSNTLGLLSTLAVLPEGGYYTDRHTASYINAKYITTYGNFVLPERLRHFMRIKDYMDPVAKEVLQEGLLYIADKLAQFPGNGPSNQYLMGVEAALYAYILTGNEIYHDMLKNGLYGYEPQYNPTKGFTPAGYPNEGDGCDSNYYHMAFGFTTRIWWYYTNNPLITPDPEVVDWLRDKLTKCLEFQSKLTTSEPAGLPLAGANAFTSRTDGVLLHRGGGHTSYFALIKDFPLASRFYNIQRKPVSPAGDLALLFPENLNSKEWAQMVVEELYPKYDHYFDARTGVNLIPDVLVDMLDEGMELAEPQPLPSESEKETEIWDAPGIIAFMHKGVYIASFYHTTLSAQSANSIMGGGPTIAHNKYLGNTLVSRKISGAGVKNLKGKEEIIASCIFGNEAKGTFLVSGRQDFPVLTWIDEGKSFEIKGVPKGSAKEVVWRYDLTDEGVEVTAGVTKLEPGDDLYLNLPIIDHDKKEYSVSYEPGKIDVEYDGHIMTYSWDSALNAEFSDELVSSIRSLRIKLPASGQVKVTIKMNK